MGEIPFSLFAKVFSTFKFFLSKIEENQVLKFKFRKSLSALIKNPAPVFQWKHYSMKFRMCHKHSQRSSESFPRFQWRFQWDFNEAFQWDFNEAFQWRFQQKLKQNPIFKNSVFVWPKIPFYRKSHFTWRNLARFGKPIIPFYRDPILSRSIVVLPACMILVLVSTISPQFTGEYLR